MGKSWNNSSKRIFFLYCYGKAQQYWVMRSHDGPQNNLCLHAILGSRYYVMLPKKKREIFKACKGIFLYGSLKKVIEISAISQSTKNRYFLVLWLAQTRYLDSLSLHPILKFMPHTAARCCCKQQHKTPRAQQHTSLLVPCAHGKLNVKLYRTTPKPETHIRREAVENEAALWRENRK